MSKSLGCHSLPRYAFSAFIPDLEPFLTFSVEIFENGFLVPQPRLAFGHFEVRVDPQSPQIEDQLTYLYK